MKKTISLFCALTMTAFLFADDWLQGSVVEVKDAEKMVVIDTIHSGLVAIKIAPTTKIELEDCGWFGMDNIFDKGSFKDLKIGRYLEVEAYYPNYENTASVNNAKATPIATEVEVHCRKLAY